MLVVLTELTLAATVWTRATWSIAAPLGLALHFGILATGLEIGLFAWLMLGLYIFVVPDRVWVWLAELAAGRGCAAFAQRDRASGSTARSARWSGSSRARRSASCSRCVSRFDHAPRVGARPARRARRIVLARVAIASTSRWLAVAHLLAFGCGPSSIARPRRRRTTTGSGAARRAGSAITKTAEHAYRQMTEVAPDDGSGHFQLGRLLLARDAGDEGLAELHRGAGARAADGARVRRRGALARDARPARRGDREGARGDDRRADDAEAQSLLNSLQVAMRTSRICRTTANPRAHRRADRIA